MKLGIGFKRILASAIAPALLVMSSAAGAASPLGESKRVALDAAPIRTDFPQIFAVGNRVDMEPGPKGREADAWPGAAHALFAAYDTRDGRIVFMPARQYMPKVEGLTPESVALRRNGVRLKYSYR